VGFLQISVRCSCVSFEALSAAPLGQPSLADATAAGSLRGSGGDSAIRCSICPVAISTRSLPNWVGSWGLGRRLVAVPLIGRMRGVPIGKSRTIFYPNSNWPATDQTVRLTDPPSDAYGPAPISQVRKDGVDFGRPPRQDVSERL